MSVRIPSFVPLRGNPTSLVVGAVLLALLVPSAEAAGNRNRKKSKQKTDCSPLLAEAEDRYRSGRLDAARDFVNTCLRARPSKRFKILSLELQAKIQLVQDDTAGASQTVLDLLVIDPEYEADPLLPQRFQRLVSEARGARAEVKVMSVSKTPESLREAPATVQVLTSEEIRRRGYVDLEAVLHDLPGFDISRGNGTIYSHIYQRGYRSESNDRMLLLIDGVEQNDVTSNGVWLSRQYPLSNVDRVEVIYGPSSTMYGANAFAGVINVMTKSVDQLLEEGRRVAGGALGGKNLTAQAQAGSGSFNTHWVDATIAGRTPDGGISFSVTGRVYQSDERDLSSFADWDFDPTRFDYSEALTLRGDAAEAFLDEHGGASELYTMATENGTTVIRPTESAVQQARELDAPAFQTELGGDPVGFSDLTDDWYVGGKVRIQNLEMGLQTWQRREGMTPWYVDSARPGADNGSVWAPEQTALYVKYNREIAQDLSLLFFSRYKVHTTDGESSSFRLTSFASGSFGLNDLVSGLPAGASSHWTQTRQTWTSNQLRNEVSLVYTPSAKFDLVTGVEFRNGSVQAGSVRESGRPNEVPDAPTGGGEHFNVRDLGFFAQVSYRPLENLKLVAGGRFDQNEVNPTGGYGDVFNPRLGVIWSPGDFTIKGIYSEAFKDASFFNKFGTNPGTRDLPAPGLEPEKVRNTELSASWQVEGLQAEVALYDATYTNVVGLKTVPFDDGTTSQFQNLGALRIRGLQASGRLELGRFDLYANYTFTDPRNTEPLDRDGEPRTDVDELRIGDIAEHQVNAGVHADLPGRFEGDLRVNWVGSRRTGEGTTVSTNRLNEIDAYTVANAALTYKDLLPGVDIQLTVNNLLDEDYVHPGIRQAGNGNFAAALPQPGRTAFVRAVVRF